MTRLVARCSKRERHPGAKHHDEFIGTARVYQSWLIDECGEYIETISECDDLIERPGRDTYACAVAGCDGDVTWVDLDAAGQNKAWLATFGACTCDDAGTCGWCQIPCAACGRAHNAAPICDCEDGPKAPTIDQVFEAWCRTGMKQAASTEGIGTIIIRWQIRQIAHPEQETLMKVIQHWLRAGAPNAATWFDNVFPR